MITFKKITAQEMSDRGISRYLYVHPSAVALIAFATILAGVGSIGADSALAEKARCSIFSSRNAAQQAFESNPKRYAWADRNKDGKACQTTHYKNN